MNENKKYALTFLTGCTCIAVIAGIAICTKTVVESLVKVILSGIKATEGSLEKVMDRIYD